MRVNAVMMVRVVVTCVRASALDERYASAEVDNISVFDAFEQRFLKLYESRCKYHLRIVERNNLAWGRVERLGAGALRNEDIDAEIVVRNLVDNMFKRLDADYNIRIVALATATASQQQGSGKQGGEYIIYVFSH